MIQKRGCEWISAQDATQAIRDWQRGKTDDPHCNASRRIGSAYCLAHHVIAYVIVTKRRAA